MTMAPFLRKLLKIANMEKIKGKTSLWQEMASTIVSTPYKCI